MCNTDTFSINVLSFLKEIIGLQKVNINYTYFYETAKAKKG